MVGLIGIGLFECLWCVSDLVIKPRKLSCDQIFKKEAASKKFDEVAYQAIKKTKFHIRSDFDYVISCELLEPELKAGQAKENKTAILCHGLGFTKYGCLKYAEVFLGLGFRVLIYDQRNHGLSGGACTSMGYYEKYDLKKLVDWCVSQFGEDCKIVTHGESMGAATVLMHLSIDQRVKCAIADCAYSDLELLLKHQAKQYYHLPCFLIPVESFLTYIRTGFWYREVSPIKSISEIDTPVLFIHGKIDNFVPTYMTKQMYACKKKNKAIYLVAGAKHAESCCKNRNGYTQKIDKFLKKFMV
ncbi:MAG: hypothetical protein K0S76_1784 [Herbinix sp.]|jgi:fermentation-respiration switch protein FrsA (DUF1100 family)|nr:hypothetical protein [Herbinix sp.]